MTEPRERDIARLQGEADDLRKRGFGTRATALEEIAARLRERPVEVSEAVRDVVAERRRQIEVEGWSSEHDDQHGDCALAEAAACYALGAKLYTAPEYHDGHRVIWPFDEEWWKPKDRRTNLVRAGALLVAEIERLDRLAMRAAAKEAGK